MELKIKRVEYTVVGYSDFEQFVNHIYGLDDYSVVADEEASNDSVLEYSIGKYDWDNEMDEYDRKQMQEFEEKGYGAGARLILVDLFQRELIPAGEYLITIGY